MPGLWRSSANRVQSVTVEVCWRPAQGETSGDFHDMVDLRDGRVAVILGDAPSSGPAAAELGEELRFELRRSLRAAVPGSDILRPLDDLLASRGMDKIATVVCAVLDPVARRAEVINAGHLPILSATGSETRFLEDRVDPPLGVATARRSITYDLGDDSALFMFTDGLVERRGASLTDGLAVALEAARGMTGAAASAAELARRATERLGQPDDDATAVSVRLRSPEPFTRMAAGHLERSRPAGGARPLPVAHGTDRDRPTPPPTVPARVALRVYLDPEDLMSIRAQAVVEDMVRRLAPHLMVEVDFIDITVSTDLAESDGVMAAPTVVRLLPRPAVRVVGGLRSPAGLARSLQLPYTEEMD